ncbi:hypothetical protein C8R45DRAFT_1019901 [Mycena sanguinolenta]|nr:hypothetical protein C8R45DRAFT_1019901 [Mycena sanguinolenta]
MLSLRRLWLFTSLLIGVHCAMDDDSRSVALLTPLPPFKGHQAQLREKLIRGLLVSRQDLTCDLGYGSCSNIPGYCCPIGGECCSAAGGYCCPSGEYCVGTGCCPNGETCSTSASKKTPIGAIAGGTVGGLVLLAIGIFLIFRRLRNRNRTQPLPARDTGIPLTPTPAEQKHGSESAYFPPPAQSVVSTLPSSAFVMSPKPAGGYSEHEVVPAQPSYPTTISPTSPPNIHAPYSEPQVVYAGTGAPTTISSPGGTQPTKNWSS